MNIKKYKDDINSLCRKGDLLYLKIAIEQLPEQEEIIKKRDPERYKELNKKIGSFSEEYQSWYSEALECIHQLLPSRADDFVDYYKTKSKAKRKEIDHENYTISDCLQGLVVRYGGEIKVDGGAAIPKFRQQLKILESLKRKFESSLFDIKYLVQADVFDNELEVAEELNKKGFVRGAGAVAGVVLEGHLESVCKKHDIKITKKKPTIADFNDKLKENDVIDTPDWRRIQYLGDIRNKCDHKKKDEPDKEEVKELIDGVIKVMKNIF